MHGKHTNADGKSCLIIKLFNRITCRRRYDGRRRDSEDDQGILNYL